MKKRMLLALVLAFAVLCMACANDADDGASSSESVSVAETGTDASAESTTSADSASSTDGTSGETSAESGTAGTDGTDMNTSSVGTGSTGTDTSGVGTGGTSSNDTSSGNTSNASSNANGSTSNGTESSGTGSGTSSESSKPAEGSENGGSVDTSGNTDNPSQTVHTHKYATTIINPTCTEDGYTLHTCSCGDSYKDNEVPATGHEMGYWSIRTVKESAYTEKGIHERQCNHCGEWMVDEEYDSLWAPPVNDEEEVYRRIMALQEVYPDWSVWDGDTYYDYRYDAWGNPIEGEPAFGYGSDDACQGFANMVSNTAFGLYWGHHGLPDGWTIKDVRVGDLIYWLDRGHVAVVLEVYDDHITFVDGNDAGRVNWYGVIDREYLESSFRIETRYDPECF